MKKLLLAFAGCALLMAASNETKTDYFDKKGMDVAVAPGDNFYDYVNGGWVKTAQIPADQSRWGSFDSLRQENVKKLHKILDEASAKQGALQHGTLEQLAGDFYASGMDTAAIEKVGVTPLRPFLGKIAAVKNYQELIDLLAESAKDGEGDLIDIYVGSDQKNSMVNILNISQAGTTLPEKGYYTRKDSMTAKIRQQLVKHAANYFVLTGENQAEAEKDAEDVLKIETLIAESHSSPVELRDPVKNYHKMSVADLQTLAPNVPWKSTFEKMGMKVDSLNVGQPEYYKALSKLLASEPINVWKNKVRFDYIRGSATGLNKAFRDEAFAFGKLFSGEKVQKDRWKTMVQLSDNLLKDVVSQLYVQRYFTPEAKRRMDSLVNNLQTVFRGRINKLSWMSEATKKQALTKLSTILKKIGYPTKWKSFADVDIKRSDFFGNLKSIDRHFYKEQVSKLGKPVDRTEWDMTTPTVNAYYNPSYNEIVFPAGILQWPFFDVDADDAINYGAIGVVIGHEMTHGFDDEGRQYDEVGNLKDWWTEADGTAFTEKAHGLIKQFDSYTVLDTLHVNGALTLGENIADLGGVTIAYDAFKLTKEGKSTEKINGFTPDQRFFLAFAQVWRGAVRPELMRTLIATNPHSPYQYRVNGTLTNFGPWYTAFNVTEKNKMYKSPADRIVIW